MPDVDLRKVLLECQKAANIGYRIASFQYTTLRNTLSDAEESVRNTALEFSTSPAYFSGATDQLAQQLLDIKDSLAQLSFAFHDDLESLHDNLSKFSITLFGRTMAGKSTLMEILTEGDGESIGKGSQRTTRDIRTYEWNGLSITDVPGIGAFEGEEDEQVAYEAAKSADLILFILTDDAPQYQDAECFSRIVSLGKPVICIMNIKVAISQEKNMKLAIRDIEKHFDNSRLNEIREQFFSYAENFGQDWHGINVSYVHLKSAFLAQKALDNSLSSQLYSISRIGSLKAKIIDVVRQKGEFFREKTFIDCISSPMLNTIEDLISQSLVNSSQGRTILSKKKQLIDWEKSFDRDGKERIQSEITQIKGELYSEIASFAEDHYEDKNADKAWEEVLKSYKAEERCISTVKDLENLCADKLQEVSRAIESELCYISKISSNKTLKMHTIVNGRRIWNWGTVVVGGALSIGSILASVFELTLFGVALVTPLKWAAAGVFAIGLGGSYIFKSRSKKEYEARRKLESNLRDNVDENCRKLQLQMERNLRSLEGSISNLLNEIDRINSVLFKLADTQKALAWKLDDHLLELNNKIITEALRLIDAMSLESRIKKVARIPGVMNTIMLNDGVKFPEDKGGELRNMMSERVGFIYDSDNSWILIGRVMGKAFDRKRIRIEDKIGVAHISGNDLSQKEMNRFRLAQQITKLAIQIEEV